MATISRIRDIGASRCTFFQVKQLFLLKQQVPINLQETPTTRPHHYHLTGNNHKQKNIKKAQAYKLFEYMLKCRQTAKLTEENTETLRFIRLHYSTVRCLSQHCLSQVSQTMQVREVIHHHRHLTTCKRYFCSGHLAICFPELISTSYIIHVAK